MVRRKAAVVKARVYDYFEGALTSASGFVNKSNAWVVIIGVDISRIAGVSQTEGGVLARLWVQGEDGVSFVDVAVLEFSIVSGTPPTGAATNGYFTLPRRLLIPPNGSLQGTFQGSFTTTQFQAVQTALLADALAIL